jgi:phage terminase Nu1 subunit (DNA packaging protein)
MTEHANMSTEEGLWVSITELASMKGVGKAAVSERVTRLEARGLIKTRHGKGKSKLVNLAEYDRVLGEVADLGRELGATTKRLNDTNPEEPLSSTDPVYTKEQARLAAYRADILKLELDERRGLLVRKDLVKEAADSAGREIASVIDSLVHEADKITILSAGGAHAIRVELKKIATKMRSRIAEQLAAAASAAPEFDPPLES